MDIPDVMNCASDGIQKSSAAANGIVLVGHRLNIPDIHAVMDNLAHIVKKDCGDERFAVLLLLLGDH